MRANPAVYDKFATAAETIKGAPISWQFLKGNIVGIDCRPCGFARVWTKPSLVDERFP
jgi:hypothetical protein